MTAAVTHAITAFAILAASSGAAQVSKTVTGETTTVNATVEAKWSYSSRVQDKKALASVKVGDGVDITWTSAALMSFEPLK